MGIAFGQGAIRGIYQAGVVHGFIVSGYFPGVVAGTSAGCITGTALALAGQTDDESKRLAIAEHHIEIWRQNPAERVRKALVDGPVGKLVGDLGKIDVTLGQLVKALRGDPISIVRVLRGLPLRSGHVLEGVLAGLFGAVEGAVHGLEVKGSILREVLMHAAQHVLSAYGMEHALCAEDAIQNQFDALVERFAPGGRSATLGALDRTELVFQTANLSRRTHEGESVVVDLARDGRLGRPDFSSANLIAAMRASCAFAPFFAGVRARELGMATLPEGIGHDDLLLDAAIIARDSLSPAIGRWVQRLDGRVSPHRLFAVHLAPLGPVPIPDKTSPFIGQALHSLKLRDELDQRYATAVVELMTELVEALVRKGEALPKRARGRYVSVDVTPIAPHDMLPFAGISVPKEQELREACAAGCRAALEALHADSLRTLPGDSLVPCTALLKHLREKYRASFQPLSDVCASCKGDLRRPAVPEPKISEAAQRALNDFPPFHAQARGGVRRPRPLRIAVPAGGVFLGVFQFGAIAALADYDIRPDLYAGASVGTIFSYLLESSLRNPTDNIPKIVDLALTVPEWVDAVDGTPKGRVDWIVDHLQRRWDSAEVRPLRDLRPRQIAAMLATDPHGETAATWRSFRKGLGALLFTPLPPSAREQPRPLDPKYRLDSNEWASVHRTIHELSRLRLDGAVELLDEIAANLGFFTPGPDENKGEVIGFSSIKAKMESLVFPGAGKPTLERHSREHEVRFIFTVTNHTLGQLEHFGFADGATTSTASPDAVEATLAASSFPLAFRRRSREEIFGTDTIDRREELYADGGIFNNFPSDTAFAYLHALTGYEATRWIGDQEHEVYLLSLTSPTTIENDLPEDDGLVWTLVRALARIDDEKVQKTLRGQHHINVLAERANPILKQEGARQAIRAKMIPISPAYGIYGHAFAFKDFLGFRIQKQEEMLASGCRRARLALEWDKDLKKNGDRRRLPQLIDEIRGEVKRVESRFPRHYRKDTCLFGRFSPREEGVLCPFTKTEETRLVFDRCRATMDRELSVPNFKL
ncbi:Hypothetical protein A7982_01439 [Minicystis rosea]|nr:Hypothetical protein A7982_01439 [Minicystis rosea]